MQDVGRGSKRQVGPRFTQLPKVSRFGRVRGITEDAATPLCCFPFISETRLPDDLALVASIAADLLLEVLKAFVLHALITA